MSITKLNKSLLTIDKKDFYVSLVEGAEAVLALARERVGSKVRKDGRVEAGPWRPTKSRHMVLPGWRRLLKQCVTLRLGSNTLK